MSYSRIHWSSLVSLALFVFPDYHCFIPANPLCSIWIPPHSTTAYSHGSKLGQSYDSPSFMSFLSEITAFHCLMSTVLETTVPYIFICWSSGKINPVSVTPSPMLDSRVSPCSCILVFSSSFCIVSCSSLCCNFEFWCYHWSLGTSVSLSTK